MKLKITLVPVILLIIVLFLSGCTQPVKSATEKTPNIEPVATSENPSTNTKPQTTQENIIEITSSGFNPGTLTVNAGDVVTFLNKDAAQHWPASAFHPTHNVYPEPGGCIGSKFDSCKGLNKDEIFAFKFNQKGTWKYHDHLNPSLYGTIIVK